MFYTKDWVFIHIPKTSGKNILSVCEKNIPDLKVPWTDNSQNISSQNLIRHNPIWWWEKRYDLKGKDFYTIVRNPYFRVLSLWNYCINMGISSRQYSFKEFLTTQPSIDTLFDLTQNSGRSAHERGIVYNIHDPQVKFIDDRFQWFKLETDLSLLEDKISLKFSDKKTNASLYNKGYRYHYTDELQEIVYLRYEKDFLRFNYSMDL